jgi:hypothetical protein
MVAGSASAPTSTTRSFAEATGIVDDERGE